MARAFDVDLRELNALCDRGQALDDLRDILDVILKQKKDDTQKTFYSEADPSGVPWKPLAESTLAQKEGKSIGRETNRLFNAIDIFLSGNEGRIFNDTPYAGFFNAVRPFLSWTLEDEQRIPEVFTKDLQKRLRT